MKILTLHANWIRFAAVKKALKNAEEVGKDQQEVKECLVVLTAVESRDEANIPGAVQRLVQEIENVAKQVQAERIVLYPYAHLSSALAKPDKALQALQEAEKELKEKYETVRAPFGWYKTFEISCKGHPLAELSREFGPEEEAAGSQALAAEKTLKSSWYVLDTKGKLKDVKMEEDQVKGVDLSKHPQLERFIRYELQKVRAVRQEPPHVRFMRKLELVDYEPASDPGNLRYYPKGRLIKALLEEFITKRMQAYGAMEVETPLMYDVEHPSLKSYLQRFPARQYTIQTPNKKTFLRFAACFGHFLIAHGAQISYRHLPLRLYELTRYSFRMEQRGELTGLRRLRAFTMPDSHCLVRDMEQAKKEVVLNFDLSKEILRKSGLDVPGDLEFAIRVTKEFYEKNKEYLVKLVKRWGKPALIEMWEERFFYFVMKYEWNFVDNLDKASAMATDQVDIENAQRYEMTFVDKDGMRKHPLVLHRSPSGAVERIIYALLEKAYRVEQQQKLPVLPLWLAPTQVRLIPVSVENHLTFSEKLADLLEKENIRVDLDDDVETVGKRIRRAEEEWVPYVLVIGEKEVKSKKVMVRSRESGKQTAMAVPSLVKEIQKKTEGLPFRPLPLPKYLSQRPIFVG